MPHHGVKPGNNSVSGVHPCIELLVPRSAALQQAAVGSRQCATYAGSLLMHACIPGRS